VVSEVAPAAGLLMDRIYARQRHVYDFTRKYYLLGRDRLIEDLAPPPGGKVLEIGCGTARNLVKAAGLYPDVDFYGIDVSTKMLETAREAVVREGLTANIRVAEADATNFDPELLFSVPGFSRVFVSYSLSMIPGWPKVLARAVQWLAPSGELHIVDFGRQERLPRWFRSGLRWWLSRFHVSPRDDLEAELRALARKADMAVTIERPYLGYAQRAICRRRAA
jgi:S-adenosylmethionine-diacylgycerolhomoserine-N-methlytransferase